MSYGPVEIVVVTFPGIDSSERIAPTLAELSATMQIRLVEVLFAIKHCGSTRSVFDQNGAGHSVETVLEPIVEIAEGLLSRENAKRVSLLLESNSVAVLLLFENVWAARFTDAMRKTNGNTIRNVHIPREVVDRVPANLSRLAAR